MVDEVLRLKAEVLGAVQSSNAIQKIGQALKAAGNTSAMKQVNEDMERLQARFGSVSAIAGTTAGSILSVGTGAVTAALSLSRFVGAMSEVASHVTTLKNLADLTGVAANRIEQLAIAAKKLGVAPEAVSGALAKLSKDSIGFTNNTSELLAELRATAGGKFAGFADKLHEDGRDVLKLFHDEMALLGQIQDPQKRANWAEKLLGSSDFGRMAGDPKALREAMDEAARSSALITKNLLEQNERLRKARAELDDAENDFNLRVAPKYFETLAGFMKRLSNFLDPNEKEIAKRQAAGGAHDETVSHLKEAQERLAEYDQTHPHGSAGLRGAVKDPNRKLFSDDVQFWEDRLAKAVKEGVKDGLKEGVQLQSFNGGANHDAGVISASWGGGASPRLRGGEGNSGNGGGDGGSGDDHPDHINTPYGKRRVTHPTGRRALHRLMQTRRRLADERVSPGEGGALLDMVSASEGTTQRGYNDAFGHQDHGDLSQYTLDQIMDIQRKQRGSSAIGRYQFMRATLAEEKEKLGLTGNEMFTPELQERLARSRLAMRGYNRWKNGQLDDNQFLDNMAHEWAGMTSPRTHHGVYPGQDTGFSETRERAALDEERRRANSNPSHNAALRMRGRAYRFAHISDQAGGWPHNFARPLGALPESERSPRSLDFNHDFAATFTFKGLPQGASVSTRADWESRLRPLPRGSTMPVPSDGSR